MIDTETEILAFAVTALGRLMQTWPVAPRMLADRVAVFFHPLLVRFDADAIKEFRIQFHAARYSELTGLRTGKLPRPQKIACIRRRRLMSNRLLPNGEQPETLSVRLRALKT
ncbi:hypothetical protein GCM10009077_39490 [Roseibium denhamense]